MVFISIVKAKHKHSPVHDITTSENRKGLQKLFFYSPSDSLEEKRTSNFAKVSQLLRGLGWGSLLPAFVSFYTFTAFGQIKEIQATCLGMDRNQSD